MGTMFHHALRRLFRDRGRPSARGSRNSKPCFRPGLLALDDRIVPSVTEIEPNNASWYADMLPQKNLVQLPTGLDITSATAANWFEVQGSISTVNDVDYFRFTLPSRSGVFFDIDA